MFGIKNTPKPSKTYQSETEESLSAHKTGRITNASPDVLHQLFITHLLTFILRL